MCGKGKVVDEQSGDRINKRQQGNQAGGQFLKAVVHDDVHKSSEYGTENQEIDPLTGLCG